MENDKAWEDFEKYMRKKHANIHLTKATHSLMTYMTADAEAFWELWQAALSHNSAQVMPEREVAVEIMAKAMNPDAFITRHRNIAYMLKDGKTQEEAEKFADWCDNGLHKIHTVSWTMQSANIAYDALMQRQAGKGEV